jgi:hypothetical protein
MCVCTILLAAEKQYKSPEEYELYTTITKDFGANDFAKVLTGLDTWKHKFPESDYASNRQQLYVQAYARSGQPAKAIEAAKPVLSGPFDTPDDHLRLIYTVVTAVQQIPSPDADIRPIVTHAARQLMAYDKMPAGTTPEDWQKARATLNTSASIALLHVALTPVREAVQAKDCANAEAGGIKVVEDFPDSVQAAWVLASAQLCLARTAPTKFPSALYLLARATALDPAKGMVDPAWQRSTAAPYFEKMYTHYHGPDPEGLRQLKATALASPLPPAGFTIASATQIEQQKQADLESRNPELAMWMRIKSALSGATGETYFSSEMKGAKVPVLLGRVVEAKPSCRPTELVVSLSGREGTPAEAVLRLQKPLAGKVEVGSEFRFEGVSTAFTREPFLLTMEVDPAEVKGLKTAPCRR